jgi:spermidine synthase
VGTRRTFLIFALAIAVVAVSGLRPVRRYALAPAAIAALIALPVGTLKANTNGEGRVIHERETAYQYARVVEHVDGTRVLELNEGQAEHSRYLRHTVLTGDYWDEYLVLPFAVRNRAPARVAMLGNAAGTTARAYGRLFPGTRFDAVEIDSELSEIGRRWFDMRGPRLSLHHEDARPYLRRTDHRYDLIGVDVYRQPYIPFYLATREFFELARDRLEPGGLIVVNVGHPEDDTTLEQALAATMRKELEHVARDAVEDTNTMLIASDAPISAERLRAAARTLPAALRAPALATAARLEPGLRGGDVFTDDRAPVEWLIDRSIVEYAAGD